MHTCHHPCRMKCGTIKKLSMPRGRKILTKNFGKVFQRNITIVTIWPAVHAQSLHINLAQVTKSCLAGTRHASPFECYEHIFSGYLIVFRYPFIVHLKIEALI